MRCNLGQKSFSNTAITLAKVSALLRSNTSAGEQPFYAWTYATVAGNDGDVAAAEEADKRNGVPRKPCRTSHFEPTPDIVQRVQQRLYDFGLNIPQIDGRLNSETTQAVNQVPEMGGLVGDWTIDKTYRGESDSTPAPSAWGGRGIRCLRHGEYAHWADKACR